MHLFKRVELPRRLHGLLHQPLAPPAPEDDPAQSMGHLVPAAQLSWVPVVGDPLTLVSGALRTAFVPFVLLVLLGKAARYNFVLLLVA